MDYKYPSMASIGGLVFIFVQHFSFISITFFILGFLNVTVSGTPTPQNDPIVFATPPTLTPFGDSDFLLFEEADAFLGLEDDPDLLKINPFYYDPKGDILLLEAILNSKPSPPLPNQEQNLPSFKEELKAFEAQTVKLSVDEPPEVELKDMPHHLEYAFLEGDNKLLVIIAKELRRYQPGILYTQNYNGRGLQTGGATSKTVLERLAGNEYYCFLDGFSGYFQIPIDPRDQEKKTFTCSYGTFAYHRMPFGLCHAPGTFQRCAVLGRRHEKHFKPIHYASKTMNDAETNYTTTEKEMLAVVYSFEKFR
nr:reverse transcriptase domain-containing protein [Tanacetum cinerariifolium]